MIMFEKFGQHQPLNRQAERYALEDVPIALSTIADAVGSVCASLDRQIAVAATPCEPFSPYPRDLVVVSDASAVSGDAVVGAVPPDHPRQMGVLLPERTMQVLPTPFHHRSQRACVTVFCRYFDGRHSCRASTDPTRG